MADVANVKVGVCSVTYNGVDLGHTVGGVEVTYEANYHDVIVDKYGETVVEKKLVSERYMAKVPLAEYTIANLKAAIPQGQYAGAANARIHFGSSSGKSAKDNSAQLVLHPINEGTRKFDVVLHKAYAANTITLQHKVDETRVI